MYSIFAWISRECIAANSTPNLGSEVGLTGDNSDDDDDDDCASIIFSSLTFNSSTIVAGCSLPIAKSKSNTAITIRLSIGISDIIIVSQIE